MRPETTFTGPDLCARPAREIVAELRSGHLDPVDLVTVSAQRIEQVEPDVNAVVTRCTERALKQATDLPTHAAQNAALAGWLAGLPVGIKDLNNVGGVKTTFGNTAMRDFTPEVSDAFVARLEQRGALVMGKTNTPEFGAGGNSKNEVFGATRNPWDTRMNAGGSSGGAAVSLATGEVWLSQGSDLMGSLRTPAAHCGVLGLRPSLGRAGGSPAMGAFLPEAVQGPMARDVRDIALFLDTMTGWDPAMPLSLDAPATPFAQAVDQDAPAPRIAFSEDQNGFAPVEGEIRTVLRAAMEQVARAGATVDTACPDLPQLNDTYLSLRGMHYGAVVDRLPPEVQATFCDRLRDNVAFGRALTRDAIYDAIHHRSLIYDTMRRFLNHHDVLAIPVVGLAPAPVELDYPEMVDGEPVGTYESWLRFSFLAVVANLPALAMPVGFTPAGLPVSLQLIGAPRAEARLLQCALFIEQALALPATPIDPIRRH